MKSHLAGLLVPVAAIAVALLLQGCETSAESIGYKFELADLATRPGDGSTASVHLKRADGAPITDARLFAATWYSTGLKQRPRAQRLVPLEPDGRGGFSYTSARLHPGDSLELAARVAPDASLMWGKVEIPR